jgi:ABC-type phosphate/phosphonate transport system permease subunit
MQCENPLRAGGRKLERFVFLMVPKIWPLALHYGLNVAKQAAVT